MAEFQTLRAIWRWDLQRLPPLHFWQVDVQCLDEVGTSGRSAIPDDQRDYNGEASIWPEILSPENSPDMPAVEASINVKLFIISELTDLNEQCPWRHSVLLMRSRWRAWDAVDVVAKFDGRAPLFRWRCRAVESRQPSIPGHWAAIGSLLH